MYIYIFQTRILSERTYLEEEYNSLRCAHCKKELEHLYNEGIGKNIKHEKYVVENGLQLYKEDREELYNGYMTSVGRLGSVVSYLNSSLKKKIIIMVGDTSSAKQHVHLCDSFYISYTI